MDYEEAYSPQYPSPNDDYGPPKQKKRRWIWRLLLVVVIVAIPLWFASNYQLDWDMTEHGFSFSFRPAGQAPTMAVVEAPVPEQTQVASLPVVPRESIAAETTLNVTSTDAVGDALTLQEIYETVRPSVVSIVVTGYNSQSTGTGIIMSEDGYIITNHHVIDGGTAITVLLYDDSQLTASLVGTDENSDLAVLKVEGENLIPAEFGDSDAVVVGDAVVAIGDPLGINLRGTMTNGIISAINRNLGGEDGSMTLLQTNAALNSGNSGGPLINDRGQVIGINAMKIGSQFASTTVEGLGFAIPIASAKPIIDDLIGQGYVAGQPAVGISGETLPAAVRSYYRLPTGVYVTYVSPTSDAYTKGVSEGDIILAVDGITVETPTELEQAYEHLSPGDTITITLYRQGETYTTDIVLIDKNAP